MSTSEAIEDLDVDEEELITIGTTVIGMTEKVGVMNDLVPGAEAKWKLGVGDRWFEVTVKQLSGEGT